MTDHPNQRRVNLRLTSLLILLSVAALVGWTTGYSGPFDKNGVTKDSEFYYEIDTHNVRLNGVLMGCIVYENNRTRGDLECFPAPTTTTTTTTTKDRS